MYVNIVCIYVIIITIIISEMVTSSSHQPNNNPITTTQTQQTHCIMHNGKKCKWREKSKSSITNHQYYPISCSKLHAIHCSFYFIIEPIIIKMMPVPVSVSLLMIVDGPMAFKSSINAYIDDGFCFCSIFLFRASNILIMKLITDVEHTKWQPQFQLSECKQSKRILCATKLCNMVDGKNG